MAFDIAGLNNAVNQDYNAAKADVDSAVGDLKSRADAGISGNYTSQYAELDKDVYPIETISAVDDMIAIIDELVRRISLVRYNPPPNVPNFQMEDHKIWNDEFADKIELSLSNYLDTLGIPSSEFQNAIFDEAHERNLQTLNDLYELADAKIGARGFTYTNDQATALKLDAQQKYQFDRNQISRDVTKLVTEWARQNYQFAIEKGISFEQFHADFTYKYCTAFIDIYKNLVLASVERFKAELAAYTEPIRAYIEAAKLPIEVGKINADIQKANIDAFIASNKTDIDEALGSYQTNAQIAINGFKTRVDAYDSIAKQSASIVQAATRSVMGIGKG